MAAGPGFRHLYYEIGSIARGLCRGVPVGNDFARLHRADFSLNAVDCTGALEKRSKPVHRLEVCSSLGALKIGQYAYGGMLGSGRSTWTWLFPDRGRPSPTIAETYAGPMRPHLSRGCLFKALDIRVGCPVVSITERQMSPSGSIFLRPSITMANGM